MNVQRKGLPVKGTSLARFNRLARAVGRLTQAIDAKYFTDTSPILLAQAGTVTLLSTIAQGNAITDREANSIRIASVTLHELLTVGAATGFARTIIFQDNLNQGVLPLVTDVLNSADVNSPLNAVNKVNKRFRILHDRVYSLVPATETAALNSTNVLSSLSPVKFLGTTAVQASQGAGSLYALRVTSLAATQPSSALNWQIHFSG